MTFTPQGVIISLSGGDTSTTHFIMASNKQFKCNIIYGDGNPSEQVIIEANNPPQARKFAEARYGGKCTSANQVG